MLVQNFDVEADRFFAGEGVHVAADGIHLACDVLSGAVGGGLEHHVFSQMRDGIHSGISMARAEAVAPIAALIVSGHFCRLGKFGIGMAAYSENDARSVREFLASEEQRQRRWLRRQNRGENEVQDWT